MRDAVTFQAQGKTWTLRFATSVMDQMEEDLDASMMEIAERMGNMRIRFLRQLYGYGLRKHQAEVTEEQIRDLLDELGLGEGLKHLTKAFQAALPTADPDAAAGEEGDAGDPPAEAGTGKNSAATGSKSD